MFRSLVAALVLTHSLSTLSASEEVSLSIDGLDRSFLLHVPETLNEASPVPLVIVYHGGGGNARSMEAMTGMNVTADKHGFLVAYPNGTGFLENRLTFNGGECCAYAMENDIDDVAFTLGIIDFLVESHRADPKRVYLTGLSNGGIVSHYVASRAPDRIAAIAPVGGTVGFGELSVEVPVPVMHIHGTNDEFLPEAGGYGKNARTDFRSVDETLSLWIAANNASVVPKFDPLPDTTEDECRVETFTYPAREDGAEVVYVRITGGGHTWPGSKASPPMLGTVCRDIDANELMWEFFLRHSR